MTAYRSIPAQTDASPWITSIGHRTSEEGVAISQDLLKNKQACYGDTVYLPGTGLRIINDTMNARHVQSLDVWVGDKLTESKYKPRVRTVCIIRSPERECTRRGAMALINSKMMTSLINELRAKLGREPSFEEVQAVLKARK